MTQVCRSQGAKTHFLLNVTGDILFVRTAPVLNTVSSIRDGRSDQPRLRRSLATRGTFSAPILGRAYLKNLDQLSFQRVRKSSYSRLMSCWEKHRPHTVNLLALRDKTALQGSERKPCRVHLPRPQKATASAPILCDRGYGRDVVPLTPAVCKVKRRNQVGPRACP